MSPSAHLISTLLLALVAGAAVTTNVAVAQLQVGILPDEVKNAAFRSCCNTQRDVLGLTVSDMMLDNMCNYTIYGLGIPTGGQASALMVAAHSDSPIRFGRAERSADPNLPTVQNMVFKCMADNQDVTQCCTQAGLNTDACSSLCDFTQEVSYTAEKFSACFASVNPEQADPSSIQYKCAYANAYNNPQ